ncbi:MAG: Rieske 2Fe-2S domain-containing protein [Bacteroidota bacterium]
MAEQYRAVLWNPQTRRYDRLIAALVVGFLVVFVLSQILLFPNITPETLIIRATGSLAFLLLHLILMIGPLARLDRRLLPLLYNRRHLGVSMFLIALVHGIFNLIQFHSLGDLDPISSLFLSNPRYESLTQFPFQILGFFALLILYVMAATSHDFWLKNLGPKRWKSLHMAVYVAYALLLGHVLLGTLQLEQHPGGYGLLILGMIGIVSLHLLAAFRSKQAKESSSPDQEGFVKVCAPEDIQEDRAKTLLVGKENIAIFKYQEKLSAVSNRCRHQMGPLGEGKVIDGCITCPWHGYQYLPHNGQSPPPFTEKVETYRLKLFEGSIWVHPAPMPPGTEIRPTPIPA